MCSAFIFRMTEFGWGQCWNVLEVYLCCWNCSVGNFSEFGQIGAMEWEAMEIWAQIRSPKRQRQQVLSTVEQTHHATWRKNSGDCHLSNTCHENLKTDTWHYIPKTVVTEWGTDLLWYIRLVTCSMGKDITVFLSLVYEMTNIIILVDQDWMGTFLFSKFCMPS